MKKAIVSIKEMLNDTDTVRDAKAKGASEVNAVDLINEIKERYPAFYDFVPDWLRDKINSGNDSEAKLTEVQKEIIRKLDSPRE